MGYENDKKQQSSRSLNQENAKSSKQQISQRYTDNRPEMQDMAQLYAAIQRQTIQDGTNYSIPKNGKTIQTKNNQPIQRIHQYTENYNSLRDETYYKSNGEIKLTANLINDEDNLPKGSKIIEEFNRHTNSNYFLIKNNNDVIRLKDGVSSSYPQFRDSHIDFAKHSNNENFNSNTPIKEIYRRWINKRTEHLNNEKDSAKIKKLGTGDNEAALNLLGENNNTKGAINEYLNELNGLDITSKIFTNQQITSKINNIKPEVGANINHFKTLKTLLIQRETIKTNYFGSNLTEFTNSVIEGNNTINITPSSILSFLRTKYPSLRYGTLVNTNSWYIGSEENHLTIAVGNVKGSVTIDLRNDINTFRANIWSGMFRYPGNRILRIHGTKNGLHYFEGDLYDNEAKTNYTTKKGNIMGWLSGFFNKSLDLHNNTVNINNTIALIL
jgi:hypothetical protein